MKKQDFPKKIFELPVNFCRNNVNKNKHFYRTILPHTLDINTIEISSSLIIENLQFFYTPPF